MRLELYSSLDKSNMVENGLINEEIVKILIDDSSIKIEQIINSHFPLSFLIWLTNIFHFIIFIFLLEKREEDLANYEWTYLQELKEFLCLTFSYLSLTFV